MSAIPTSEPEPLPPFWSDDGPPTIDAAAVRPTTDDVAELERTRTFRDDGTEGGTFDDQTRPTAAEVEALIDEALDVVLGQLPDHADARWHAPIRRLVALRAALDVEASYFREQQTADAPWTTRYADDLAALQGAIADATWIA